MSLIKVIISSTGLDEHNEQMTKEILRKIVESVNEYYIPVDMEHNSQIASYGKIISTEVSQGENGEYYLYGIIELFTT